MRNIDIEPFLKDETKQQALGLILDYVQNEVRERTADRLNDFKRREKTFEDILNTYDVSRPAVRASIEAQITTVYETRLRELEARVQELEPLAEFGAQAKVYLLKLLGAEDE